MRGTVQPFPRLPPPPIPHRPAQITWYPARGQRAPAIVTIIAALGGGVGIAQAINSFRAPVADDEKLVKRIERCESNIDHLFTHAEQVKESDATFRASMGSAWASGRIGRINIRGVEQNLPVYSEGLDPPVWYVSSEVMPYPRIPRQQK